MNVKILEITPNATQLLYRAFKTCVSDKAPTEIEMPEKEQIIKIAGYCTKEHVPDQDKMIDLIKRHIDHESVLEHINITFAIEGVSRSLSHQLVRHRVASYSQQSQRYVNGENFGFVIPNSWLKVCSQEECEDLINSFKKTYKKLIDLGVPQEDARYLLPNATTTNLIMTMNLREFRHFYSERSCKHAQWEIRELADRMMVLVSNDIPFAGYKSKKCGVSCFECKEVK